MKHTNMTSRPAVWIVKWYDFNAGKIMDCDIIKHQEVKIKQLKKQCQTKEEFAERMRRELIWRYWSKSEYELIIELDSDGRVWLIPWCGCRDPEQARIDVSDRNDFDWRGFAMCHIHKYKEKNRAKIDIFDQIEWRWTEFIDYCWCTRLKYERDNPKFYI